MKILHTPTLGGVAIRKTRSSSESGSNVAHYSLPLAFDSGSNHYIKLGSKADKITLRGYLLDGATTAREQGEKLRLATEFENGKTPPRRHSPMTYTDEFARAYKVQVISLSLSADKEKIGRIDIEAVMYVVTTAAPIVADTGYVVVNAALPVLAGAFAPQDVTPPPPLPPRMDAAEKEKDSTALRLVAPAWKPPPTPAKLKAAADNGDPSLFARLRQLGERLQAVRRFINEARNAHAFNPLGFVGEALDAAGILPADAPFTFTEILAMRTLFAADGDDPKIARETFAAIFAASAMSPPPDDTNPVAVNLYQRDERRKADLRAAALVGKVLADGRGEFQNRANAESERQITNAMFAAAAAENPELTAALRAASETAFAEVIPRLASVQQFAAASRLPSIIASYRFTGNDAAAAVIARGNINNLACSPPFYV